MGDYYAQRRHERVTFDPMGRNLWKPRDAMYRERKETDKLTSEIQGGPHKICIIALCVVAVVTVGATAVALGIILSADGGNEDTEQSSATTTETSTMLLMTTTTQTPTTTTPEYNATATTISYAFANTFPENLVADEYIVYVSTEPDLNLLNSSITWNMIQSADPPYAYIAMRCADFFLNGGCSNAGNRRKREMLDSVIVHIGNEECNNTGVAPVCNGELQAGTTYYLLLQLITTDGTVESGGFSNALSTEMLTGSWLAWTAWTECTVNCGGGVQARSRECDMGAENLDCVGDESQTLDCNNFNCSETVQTSTTVTSSSTTTTGTTTSLTTTQPPTTTTTPEPEFNVTATTISYTFVNTFPENVMADEYIVYVSTEPDSNLLNDSITWGMVQGADPPYAYVAMRCTDFLINSGCSNAGNRKKRQMLDRVIVQIGNGECYNTGLTSVCNGELQAGTTYYLLLQLITTDGTVESGGFSNGINTEVYGEWAEWGVWGSCDLTCGGGIQRRSRDCEGSEFCVGVASTSQRCNAQACPIQVLAGSWLAWTSWTDCTASCDGGVQARSRECDMGVENLDCVGDESQKVDCNTWTCPDCSQTCTTGYLSESCTHCECHGGFEGRVQSTTGLALNNVKISLNDAPYHTINTTSINGRYSLDKLCVFHVLLFHKDGYTSQIHEAHWLPNIIQLEGQESLMMDLHPTSKKRIVGDDVLFCCAAIGNPLPEFYEWFKDGLQLAGESGSTLSLTSVTSASAGTYRCRANTKSQAIYSSEATLTVKENSDDFCPESTESKFQQLPSGCEYEGDTVIEVGDCANLRCRGDSVSNETCNDPERFCCAATQFESVSIPCGDFNFTVFKTVACGCAKCTRPVLDIQGFVLAADDNTPMANVAIYFNKSVVAETARNGQFYFNVPEGTLRVSMTAKPQNESEYANGVSVLTLNEDADGVYYTTIKLAKVIALEPINATEDQTLMLGKNESHTYVEVDIEANSFYDEDGNLYQDAVIPYVSVIESTSEEELESAPGDFTTTDDNGESEILQTYGMVKLDFKTASGQSLQVVKDVHMDVPAGVLGTVDDDSTPGSSNPLSSIKIYIMNSDSGKWEEVANLQKSTEGRRRKRQNPSYGVTIAGITPGSQWFNFDAVAQTTCYSKIRVFESETFSQVKQLTGAQVFAFVSGNDETYSFSTTLASGNDATNGYCIVHRCDKEGSNVGFKGYLVVKKDGKYLVPAVNNTGLNQAIETQLEYNPLEDKLETKYKLSGNKGPFYDWERKWPYSPTCIAAPFDDHHFRFHLQKEDQCYQFQELKFRDDLTRNCKARYFKSWYSAPEMLSQEFTTCYIRVKIAHYTNSVKVQALSRIGNFEYKDASTTIRPGDNYGYHENCTVGGVICVKVKPPGLRGCSTNPAHNSEDGHTHVTVTARYKTSGRSLNVSSVRPDFTKEHTVVQTDSKFVFKMELSGTIGGIYCETGTLTGSIIDSFDKCMDANEDGHAVQFGDSVECGAEVALIIDTSGSMSSYSSQNMQWMLQIAENFAIGPADTRVSLTLVYNTNNVLWDLTSNYTSSNEQLVAAINNYPTDEAQFGSFSLGPALEYAYNNILSEPRDGAAKVIIMFWDGDNDLSTTVAGFEDTRILSVAPNTGRPNVQTIVESIDDDLFYLNQHDTTAFVDRLREIFQCA